MIEQLESNYIFAVIRGTSAQDAVEISKAAIEGGIRNIEVAYTTPDASQAIAELVSDYSSDDRVVIGAGTVLSVETAEAAIEAGAQFLVSPHYDANIMAVVKDTEVLYMPGCLTATEIVTASQAGAAIIKLFPGGLVGPSYIKDIHGPLPTIKMMPSGGVSIDNIAQWKANGAVAVGIGSALIKTVKEKGYAGVTEEAAKFVQALEEA